MPLWSVVMRKAVEMWKTECRLHLSRWWTTDWAVQAPLEHRVEFVWTRLCKESMWGSGVDNFRVFHMSVENLV